MADTDLFIVEQVKLAASKREIAQILLRVSDAILMSHGEVLMAQCRFAKFPQAAQFISMRLAVLDAVRDRDGLLPEAAAKPLENWRVGFAAYAQSTPQ